MSPNPAAPGAAIDVRGTGFGTTKKRVVYGASGSTRVAGDFTVSHWEATVVRCTVPATLAAGRYWVVLAGADGRIESNRFEPFTVSGASRTGAGGVNPAAIREHLAGRVGRTTPHPTGQLAPGLLDLAIEGVEPAPGSSVRMSAYDGKVNVTVLVRNRGAGQASFVVAALGRTTSGPLGIPTDQLAISPTVTLRRGQTARVAFRIPPQGWDVDEGVWHFHLDLHQPETTFTTPLPFADRDASNNTLDVRYDLQPTAYNVTATLTRLDIRDDCDSASKGDWIVGLIIRGIDTRGVQVVKGAGWPPGDGISSVDSGSTQRIGISAALGWVDPGSDIRVLAYARDCDSDAWVPTSYLGADGCAETRKCSCGGEDVPEVSSAIDEVGSASIQLAPATWIPGGSFNARSGGGDCGSGAFRAYFEISSEPVF